MKEQDKTPEEELSEEGTANLPKKRVQGNYCENVQILKRRLNEQSEKLDVLNKDKNKQR